MNIFYSIRESSKVQFSMAIFRQKSYIGFTSHFDALRMELENRLPALQANIQTLTGVAGMKDYLNEIDTRFPVRNTKPQKDEFIGYVFGEAGKSGYFASEEHNGVLKASKAHRNIVIGSPENAGVVFTAHYDTPRRALLPNLMLPLNPVLKWIYIFLPVLAMLAVSIGAAFTVRSLSGLQGVPGRLLTIAVYLAVYFGLFMLMLRGPANRHNRNDNTSGTAGVLSLAEKLTGCPGIAFILFDDEEKGKQGSKAYAQYRPEVKSSQLVVNMDCIGNGGQFLVSASESAMNDPRFQALASSLEGIGAKIYPSGKASMNSDQKSFEKGIGICACLYKKGIGFYTPRIHTAKDTVASPENISRLTDALASFARNIPAGSGE